MFSVQERCTHSPARKAQKYGILALDVQKKWVNFLSDLCSISYRLEIDGQIWRNIHDKLWSWDGVLVEVCNWRGLHSTDRTDCHSRSIVTFDLH